MEKSLSEDEKLWQNLKIKFRLEGSAFPDNKIFGIIDVEPESARRLIKQFELVINNRPQTVKFDPQYRTISASGFDPNRKNFSAVVKAKPINGEWARKIESEPRSFHFFDKVFALSPIISFDWPDTKSNQNSKPSLVVRWNHIGDAKAQKYILYLDDKEIKHVRHRLIRDHLEIRIQSLDSNTKYTLQIAATHNNGKETCRSDPFEFIVPDKKPDDQENEIITVSNERLPPSLPVVVESIPEKESETQVNQMEQDLEETIKITDEKDTLTQEAQMKQKSEENTKTENVKDNVADTHLSSFSQQESNPSHLQEKYLLNLLKLQIESRINHSPTSCCQYSPHETFLGTAHYFVENVHIINESPSPNLQRNTQHSTPSHEKTPMNNNNSQNEL